MEGGKTTEYDTGDEEEGIEGDSDVVVGGGTAVYPLGTQ